MRAVQQWTNTSSSWVNTGGPIYPQGNPIGAAPEVPILVTRKDGRLGKLKRNLVVQNENDTDAKGPPNHLNLQSDPQPGHPHLPPPVTSTSRDPISPEPESIFDNHQRWNNTGTFTDQKKVNKKVVTSLFAEVDALTEVFVDNARKSAIPGEPTIALSKEAVAYEDALVVKLREALKKF
ncbi:hypothetical protein O181_130874 [Austropuccinia psidii MF-1]|uniref:Uncharacterized protein n=1 Tax=Austropuccinia psidii MF-1 TaxID=1389203 RepID=A0A9Q3L4N5_9BASI|nr:hypothetical protein [Austropuccinia psidii MF-1]